MKNAKILNVLIVAMGLLLVCHGASSSNPLAAGAPSGKISGKGGQAGHSHAESADDEHVGHDQAENEAEQHGDHVQKDKHDHADNAHLKAGKEGADHKHDGAKDIHKDEPVKEKPRAGHNDPHAQGKRDEHGHDEHEEEQVVRLSETEMKQFGIELATAGSGSLESEISLPGEVALNADRVTHIVPRIPGVVKEVRKRMGDRVKQGEVMAVLESRELADAKAEYLAAVERVKLARAKFTREERLWNKKISAEQEYLDAKQALAEQRIALRSAEQKLYALGFSTQHVKQLPGHSDSSLTRYEVTAPFDSTVIEKHISLGELLKDGSEPFVVADLSTVWVNLNVYQKDIGGIRSGQRVLIDFDQEKEPTEGRIDYLEPIVKGDTRTALARVIVPNHEGRWRPGMFVTARVLTDDSSAAVVVPPTAIQYMGKQQVVFVKTGEGFEPRNVSTGKTTEGGVEVISGVTAGERYAVKGTLTLKAQLSKGEFGGHSH